MLSESRALFSSLKWRQEALDTGQRPRLPTYSSATGSPLQEVSVWMTSLALFVVVVVINVSAGSSEANDSWQKGQFEGGGRKEDQEDRAFWTFRLQGEIWRPCMVPEKRATSGQHGDETFDPRYHSVSVHLSAVPKLH